MTVPSPLEQLVCALFAGGAAVCRPGASVAVAQVEERANGELCVRASSPDEAERLRDLLGALSYSIRDVDGALEVSARPRALLLQFSMPVRLPTFNPMLRTHWSTRRKQLRELGWRVHEAVPYQQRPVTPLEHIVVEVDRYNTNEPDHENLIASAKLLLDVLQPMHHKARPYGLGYIRDDATWCVHDLVVKHIPSRSVRTDVRIYASAPAVAES